LSGLSRTQAAGTPRPQPVAAAPWQRAIQRLPPQLCQLADHVLSRRLVTLVLGHWLDSAVILARR
jgi:hypothetical protein